MEQVTDNNNNNKEFIFKNNTEIRGKSLEDVVNNIINKYTGDLTNIIHKIRILLKDDTQELTDLEIEDLLLQLPIIIYDIIEDQEIVGLRSDISNQLLKEANSEAYKLARGTIPERQSFADLQTREQQLEKIIYDRSYKAIKQRVDIAIETLNAVKRVQGSRQQRYDLRKEKFLNDNRFSII